jgi:superfamily II DNA or RNA helicase
VSWFDSVRKETLPGIWSHGVRIARTPGNVVIENRTDSEITLRVRPLGDGIVPTVTLYLDEEEWTCDCGAPVDPCAHIAAAAVAVHQNTATTSNSEARATPNGVQASPSTESATNSPARKLVYCLWSDPQGLALSRELLSPDDTSTPLRISLNDPTARALVKELMPREQDLTLDRLIGSALGRYRLGPTQLAVITLLDGAYQVSLDGRKISVSTDTLLPRAKVVDSGAGVQVELERPAELQTIVGPGVGLAANVLRPLAETELSGLRWEKLPNRRYFGPDELGELVTKVLPQLQRRMFVDIDTDKLPGLTRRVPPSVVFDLSTEGDTLVVSAHLVYGNPPLARVEKDRLVQLGASAPRRDMAAEKALEHQLRDELDLLIDRPFCLQDIDAAHFSERLKLWQQRHGTDAVLSRAFPVTDLVPEIIFNEQSLTVRFISNTQDAQVEVSAEVALRAVSEGLSQVPLANGLWGALPTEWLAMHGDRLKDLLAARDKTGALAPAARVAAVDFCNSVGLERPNSFEPYAALLADGLPEAIIPSDLNAELRAYQRKGINWLSAAKAANVGAILADDMGLGKTLQALSVMAGRTLVICPRSVVHNWISEAKRFRPTLRCAVYHGQGRHLDETQDLTVTTYALLRLDQEELKKVDWDIVILDEAQAIKNPESQAAEAACTLNGGFRLLLTGTPIENRLEELWSLMHFANPGVLGTLSSFKSRFSVPIAAGDGRPAQRLRSLIRPFVMRRHKSDVLPELPPRTDDILWVELDELERDIYNSLLWDARNIALKRIEADNNLFAALEALLRLRQAACHLGLLPSRSDDNSSKVSRLADAVDEIVQEGHRALVFSQWTSLLSKIEPALTSRSIEFARLDGSTRDRQSVVEAFQSDAGAPVLLASLQAGGTGLNLTGADHVFLTDPWWNPAVEDQAASRAHRIGQERPVFVHRMVAKDTVEERVIALQQRKRELGSLLDGADPTAGLTREELLQLIE